MKNGMSLNEQLAAKLGSIETNKNKNHQYQPYEHDDRDDIFDNRNLSSNADNKENAANFEWPERFDEEQRQLIGAEICNARQQANMSQTTLGRYCNLTTQQISAIENGKVARIDKATIKRIGHYLKKDFNEEMMYICSPSNKPTAVSSTKGRELILDDEHTIKLKGHNFEIRCTLSEYDFKITMKTPQLVDETTIYQGKKANDILFLEALKEVVKRINKGI